MFRVTGYNRGLGFRFKGLGFGWHSITISNERDSRYFKV